MKQFDNLRETEKSVEEIFEGLVLHVQRSTVELPNGKDATREIVRHIGAACVIPITDDNKVIVEKQFRFPVNKVLTEIPAGKLDSKEEDRLEAAKRELLEETGITADEWVNLGLFYPAAAYSDEAITMFLAKGLHKGSQKLDDDEFLNIEEVPLTDLVEQVMNGEIPDAKTQTAVLKAARYLGI